MAWTGQKQDPEPFRPAPPAPAPAPAAASGGTAPSPYAAGAERPTRADVATIGKSLEIKGELTGDENLTIEGKVEGKIVLHGHDVTIGPEGRVNAEIHARAVTVGGTVKGNITADDKVELASSGKMTGDIRAPRVVLADGARFKGSIDMDPKQAAQPRAASSVPARDASTVAAT
jgi:cytoskeletal protein CcmA (bactofilin family)